MSYPHPTAPLPYQRVQLPSFCWPGGHQRGPSKAPASTVLSAPRLVRRPLTRSHGSMSASEPQAPGDHEKALNFTPPRPSL